MKIAVLGTGMVGTAIASKLVALGHSVTMGAREAGNSKADAWAKDAGTRAQAGTFAEASHSAELVFNCTKGANSLEALRWAGSQILAGKVVIDVANILSPGPRGPESLGEQIQSAFPAAKVVKTLNTVNCDLMVNPRKLPGVHTMFLCGNDDQAKKIARELLEAFGWSDIVDLGDITNAGATEAYLPLWLALWKTLGTLNFNIKVVR